MVSFVNKLAYRKLALILGIRQVSAFSHLVTNCTLNFEIWRFLYGLNVKAGFGDLFSNLCFGFSLKFKVRVVFGKLAKIQIHPIIIAFYSISQNFKTFPSMLYLQQAY